MSKLRRPNSTPTAIPATVLILAAFLVSGCSRGAIPRRNSVRVGMSFDEVFLLYEDIDPLDADTSKYLPQSKPVSSRQEQDCISETYRFYLRDRAEPATHLLTFKSCKLSEDARQVIRDRAYRKVANLAKRRSVDPDDISRVLSLIEASVPEYSRFELIAIEPEQ